MCGIFGYIGKPVDQGQVGAQVLADQAYRGYDSWGLAVTSDDGISVVKHTGGVQIWPWMGSGTAIGHTRWATHGGVTDANAHPHLDCTGRIAIVHNGVIDNADVLRASLKERGHHFQSQTDSEVAAHMLEEKLALGLTLVAALSSIFTELHGLNAIIAMDSFTRTIAAKKNFSPIVLGANCTAWSLASDKDALRSLADRYFVMEDGQLVSMSHQDGIQLYDAEMNLIVNPKFDVYGPNDVAPDLGRHRHWLDKEINDQPPVLREMTKNRQAIAYLAASIEEADEVILTGCGTSNNAAAMGKSYINSIARRRVIAEAGSEFEHQAHLLGPGSLVVLLSQSGETADLLTAAAAAEKQGAKLAALVNVKKSTLDRKVSQRIYMNAGPEVCVLSTKDYTAKLAALLLTAHMLNGTYDEGAALVLQAADAIEEMMKEPWLNNIRHVARFINPSDHMFIMGRKFAKPSADEAALKIKEVSYIHAEGFAAGELKHGVIALAEKGRPYLMFAPDDDTRTDMLTAAAEVKARGGLIIGVGQPDPVFDLCLTPAELGDANPLIHAVIGQQLAYELALLRGTDPDKPRNLAKSVTVK